MQEGVLSMVNTTVCGSIINHVHVLISSDLLTSTPFEHKTTELFNSLSTEMLASFQDLPLIHFLIICSMQKGRGKAWTILSTSLST